MGVGVGVCQLGNQDGGLPKCPRNLEWSWAAGTDGVGRRDMRKGRVRPSTTVGDVSGQSQGRARSLLANQRSPCGGGGP